LALVLLDFAAMGLHCLGWAQPSTLRSGGSLVLLLAVVQTARGEVPWQSALRGVGGGRVHSRALTPSGASLNRSTWTGCQCKEGWSYEDATCASACCNPDNDTVGEWCMVKDSDCEDSDWGYCRPAGLILGNCQDSPPGWADSDGDGCVKYGQDHWCTPDGKQGVGWDKEWGTFEAFKYQDHTAVEACCVCGGGGDVKNKCADTAGWTDRDGDTCSSYHSSNWCTSDGRSGVRWNEDWGTIANYSRDEVSAFAACCACGGGGNATQV